MAMLWPTSVLREKKIHTTLANSSPPITPNQTQERPFPPRKGTFPATTASRCEGLTAGAFL
ncbi:hypothetical protein BJX63DRAFT_285484 [Aspergillus granulosus]|uniref:Uncharacterized protein n=1 Tax=Aspergillus granulosus TaxID=176169 RepID=A0ABR4H748_9EURO